MIEKALNLPEDAHIVAVRDEDNNTTGPRINLRIISNLAPRDITITNTDPLSIIGSAYVPKTNADIADVEVIHKINK